MRNRSAYMTRRSGFDGLTNFSDIARGSAIRSARGYLVLSRVVWGFEFGGSGTWGF